MIIETRLHPKQANIMRAITAKRQRYFKVVASRGFGKSILICNTALMALNELQKFHKYKIDNKNVSIVGPTESQVFDVYMPLLDHRFGLKAYKGTDGEYNFANNIKLKLWSYRAIERMRGTGQYFILLDESSSWEDYGKITFKSAWESIMEPCIMTRWPVEGRMLSVTTPFGYNYAYDMYNFQQTYSDEWCSFKYTYKDSPYISAAHIEKLQKRIDPIQFAREYLADFAASGNRVFYTFDRKKHVVDTKFEPAEREPILLGIDFNVGIMATSCWLLRRHDGVEKLFGFDYFQGDRDTYELVTSIKDRFPSNPIHVYPDATGGSRKSSAGNSITDIAILRNAGFNVIVESSNPSIKDSVNSSNSALWRDEIIISNNCLPLIDSFDKLEWAGNGNQFIKNGHDHFADGFRYLISREKPVYTVFEDAHIPDAPW